MAVGSIMPWFSLFAGLQPYRGASGLYGQILLGIGVTAMVAGMWLQRRRSRAITSTLLVAGALVSVFTLWLCTGLFETYGTLRENPMYVARLGPGLFMAMLGALTLTVAAVFARRRDIAR